MEYFRRTAGLSAKRLVDQIHILCKEVGSKFNADDGETYQLELFSNNANRLSQFTLKSDFPGVPANTYRSSLRLMAHILMAAIGKMSSEQDKRDLFTIIYYANKWMKDVDTVENISGIDGKYSFEESRRILQMFVDDGIHCFHAFLNDNLLGVNITAPFEGLFRYYNLRGGSFTVQPKGASIVDKLKTLVSHQLSVDTISHIATQEMTKNIPKRVFDAVESFGTPMFKVISFLKSPIRFFRNIQVNEYNEDVVSRYEIYIDPDTGSVDFRERKSLFKNKLRYCIIKSKGIEFRNQVIFFVHGGGFIGSHVDFFNYGFLDELGYFLPGVTIINIDISSSVDGRFPRQLQEILDLYVYLFSTEKREADSPIPPPQDIILLGESSGGSHIASLTLILNDIRKKNKNFSIKMPRSLVPIYGRFFNRLHVDPSQFLTQWVDICFLNVYSLLAVGETYCAFRKKDANGNWYLITHEEEVPKDWMWRTDEYQLVDHPYVSPGTYSDWESLSDVELHAIGLNMDGILHDSVYLARKWRGKVNLVVLDGLPHAFSYVAPLPGFGCAREGNREIFKTVKQSLGWKE